ESGSSSTITAAGFVRWYQTGVPLPSTIMANRPFPAATAVLSIKYQPGAGLPAAGCVIADTTGESGGRPRIPDSSVTPLASLACTTAAWFSASASVTLSDGAQAVVMGALTETAPPAIAVMPSVRLFVPVLHTTA